MELGSHQRMLTAIATRMVGAADADDIVQETFLRALARPPVDDDAPIAPWLATVARNLAVDLLRYRGRLVELDACPEASVEPLPPALGLPRILAGLGGLTTGEVTVLLLRDALDLDVEEVSAALDTSPGSVRVLHHRARKKAAVAAPLAEGLVVLDRFLTWLLARSVAGLPLVGRPAGDPGLALGVLGAHLTLLDAVIALARSDGDERVEGRARLSRGIARLALGRPDAAEDLRRAILLGADRTLAEARLGPLLYSRGEPDAALDVVISALTRGDHPQLHGVLHRVAVQVYLARADSAAAEPHLAALRALSERDAGDAYAWVASAALAMAEERFEAAGADLEVALARVRAAGNSRNEAGILNNLAFASLCAGDVPAASTWATEGLTLARVLGDRRREATLVGNLAIVAQLEGRLDAAASGYSRAAAQCSENGMRFDAELLRTHAAVLAHQRGHPRQAVTELRGVTRRLGDLPGLSLYPRVQLLAALAELGRVDVSAFDALAEETARVPHLARALGLYRCLVGADPAVITRGLGVPAGTTPTDQIARLILERVVRARTTAAAVRKSTPAR